MSSGELFALLDRAQNGDDAACEQVLQENAGLIWSIVRRYYGCGVETDDLYQLGCIGFIKAVKGFNLTYGTQFSTYAVPKIAGEIRRFLRDDGAIKVGRSIREKGQALSAARERLRYRLGRDPRLSELSEETGLTPEEIASVELATGVPESLQQETAEGLTLESTLGTDSPEESMVVGTGFVQVNGNQVLMVTDLALNSSQIDEGSVERAIQEAQEVLKTRSEMSREEQARFEANLTKQIMMLNFKRKHKSPGR